MPPRPSTRSASVDHISFGLNSPNHRQSKRVSKTSSRIQSDQRQQKERRAEAEAAAAAVEQQRPLLLVVVANPWMEKRLDHV